MKNLSKQRLKEKFLTLVNEVTKDEVFAEIKNNTEDLDLYTYFITKNCFASGMLDDRDVNEFVANIYADWYFMHKNNKKTSQTVQIFSEEQYSPACLTGMSPLKLIKSGKFDAVLPISLQYINRLEDKYFIAIRTDKLYGYECEDFKFEVRLYLNLPHDKLLEFGKEFLDKAYSEEFPALIKILNNDYRCDTIIIYTDYVYAEKVVEVINSIKSESRAIFSNVGAVSTLLGVIDDYIGFGELSNNNTTYFSSRCQALSGISQYARIEALKSSLVAMEQELIVTTDGKRYTISEYLAYLIERNAIKLVEDKIERLEESGEASGRELERLYEMRDNIRCGLNIDNEVKKLKRSITRKNNYSLSIEGVGEDDFNYTNKLYRLFTTEDERLLNFANDRVKKLKISSNMFKLTDDLFGMDTRTFLNEYFKAELAIALKTFIDKELDGIKRTQKNGVLANIRKKSIARLKSILNSILDDGDEGRDYIDGCIYDYVRILATDALENVEITIDNRQISISKDVNTDIISLLPEIHKQVEEMTISTEFVDKMLKQFDINKDNLCINTKTKNIHKVKARKCSSGREYYYNPDGYLSK